MAGIGSLIFGSKPTVPKLKLTDPKMKKVDLADETSRAIATNKENLPAATELASSVNAANQDQLLSMLRKAIPGYDQMMETGGNQINQMLSGQLPDDVVAQIQRTAAQRSWQGGFAGSGMSRNLEGRDIGLNSLQMTQQGIDSAMKWMTVAKANAVPGQFDVSNMFVSPAQAIGVAQFNSQADYQTALAKNQVSQNMWQTKWMQSQIDAAPDPTWRGIFDTSMEVVGMAAGILGGMMGGGGGGGGVNPQAIAGGTQATANYTPQFMAPNPQLRAG